jgi:four helix bundle protein
LTVEYRIELEGQNAVVFDVKKKYRIDLRERLLDFSVNTMHFLATIPYKKEYDVFRYQLSRSASSIGANYEESQTTTYKEFHHKIMVCLRETRETQYWLRIIDRLKLGDKDLLLHLKQEATALILIFGSIEAKVRK